MESNRILGAQRMDEFIRRSTNEHFSSEDIVGVFGPLLKELEELHENEKIGLSQGLESFDLSSSGRLCILPKSIKPIQDNLKEVNRILPDQLGSFDIVSQVDMITDTAHGGQSDTNDRSILNEEQPLEAPVYLSGYRSFETQLGHHDPQTDLHTLGLFMASLAIGIDLREKEKLRTLRAVVENPVYAHSKVHPNILSLILDMVELDRRKRIRDASSARIRLENYQDYNSSNQEDLEQVVAQYTEEKGDRNQWILSKLRNRLFDLSRRNRLIYFKKSSRYVNLTLSSVPNVLDYKNIRPEKLFIWNETIEDRFKNAEKIKLNHFLMSRENPQILNALKKVYYEGNRDQAEFGFNQLKLVVCFLNWYNYKENQNEKIVSPLLFLPVRLKKRKGINDHFTLEIEEGIAEVNPVLAYYLRELYDIQLPRVVDLSSTSIEEIFKDIQSRIISKSNIVQLEMIKKPRLRLIHSLAKRSFEAYQKKVKRSVSRSIWDAGGDYSYDAQDYRPLGLKLFNDRVKKNPSLLEFLIDPDYKLEQGLLETETKKELFRIEHDGSVNPYLWEFDLCNITIGNFNYQRMTLVNDYDSLIREGVDNDIFEKLFSRTPKEGFKHQNKNDWSKNNYTVIPADPTQQMAVQRAIENQSYIIQGPPGTGKSQTIANLLASQVALGKSVLFISEKRAALDVVYARMSQSGLRDICTLIHDSQSDKKSFIFDIKDTYEGFSKEDHSKDEIENKRRTIVSELERQIQKLEQFHEYQNRNDQKTTVRKVIDILLANGGDSKSVNPNFLPLAPDFEAWQEAKKLIIEIEKLLHSSTQGQSLKTYPFFRMGPFVAEGDSSNQILQRCNILESGLSTLVRQIKKGTEIDIQSLKILQQTVDALKSLAILKREGILDVLKPNSSMLVDYENALRQNQIKQAELEELREKNSNWIRKPGMDELKRLSQKYNESSSGFLNMLTNKKGKFIEMLSQYYDFSAHMIAPEPNEIFGNMAKELELVQQINSLHKSSVVLAFLKGESLNMYKEKLERLRSLSSSNSLLDNANFISSLDKIDAMSESLEKVEENSKLLIGEEDSLTVIYDRIDEIRMYAPSLFSMAPRLKDWYGISESIRDFVLNDDLSMEKCDRIVAHKYLLNSNSDSGASINGSELFRTVEKIKTIYDELQATNSALVVESVKQKFQSALDLNYIPSYELTDEQKKKKKSYQEGRSILENEFSKKIRYKSIRELADGDTGVVINDLKPIWMMSPLSVSDTLPLKSMFDLVIFDEASQITVEEGVPPLFRADKAIIVGDEMQMPPSDFFSTKVDESDSDAEFMSMDAESLLNQGVRKLPQVTLGWHYRSRKEALINFSNFAFYGGRLMSIPDVSKTLTGGEPIEVFEREEAKHNVEKLLKGSITYHHLPNGVYHQRMNNDEADYIAYLTREVLLGETEKTLGIVAFSMQQQGNIENALSSLASKDDKFAVALEEAYAGKEEEEFTGLFVKNLENVQGDERDIMILSVCYGYSPKGKMLMNFGPINRRGGEKRLNVIFSRAKHHMAVVSSIKYTDITNEYNEGANYLKKYLHYAECISNGQSELASTILENLGRSHKAQHKDQNSHIQNQLKSTLETKGYFVETNLGQSSLKIDLGIKKQEDQKEYSLGIVIDHAYKYEKDDVVSEYFMKNNVLDAFGWKVINVYAIDWIKNRNLVIQSILSRLESSNEMKKEDLESSSISSAKLKEVEMQHEGKNTFWTISISGKEIKTILGSLGTEGAMNTQYFESEQEAQNEFESQIAMRKGRGFTIIERD